MSEMTSSWEMNISCPLPAWYSSERSLMLSNCGVRFCDARWIESPEAGKGAGLSLVDLMNF